MALALLTPVPLEHLEDGLGTCESGRVAFGSQAWQVFGRLPERARVLIYASHGGDPRPVASWDATFIRYISTERYLGNGRRRYRPPSAEEEDVSGYWAGYYEVSDLRRLPLDEQVAVGSLRDEHGRRYPRAFIPEGPIVVTDP